MPTSQYYYTERISSIIAAIILLQTLFFKFTGAPVSIHIFTELGMEPWGRIGTGIVELIAGILLFIPRYSLYGALLSLGTMSGAILSHLLFLGINVENDNGKLFYLALLVSICSLIVIYLKRQELFGLLSKYLGKK